MEALLRRKQRGGIIHQHNLARGGGWVNGVKVAAVECQRVKCTVETASTWPYSAVEYWSYTVET